VIAAIVSALAAAIKLAATWLGYARDKLLLSLGGAQQKNTDLQGRIDALKEGNKAREDARRNIERNAGGVMQDDGFRRADEDGDN
jgi:hypothetical protein